VPAQRASRDRQLNLLYSDAGGSWYHRERRRDGIERDLVAWEEVAPALLSVFAKLWAAYSRHGLTARTVTVKIKYANFRQITRSRSCSGAVTSQAIIEPLALDLLQPHFPPRRGVRLLGVTLSNFDATPVTENRQIPLACDSRHAPSA
jgi:DNA polymerase IV